PRFVLQGIGRGPGYALLHVPTGHARPRFVFGIRFGVNGRGDPEGIVGFLGAYGRGNESQERKERCANPWKARRHVAKPTRRPYLPETMTPAGFQLESPYAPKGDQPAAIAALTEGLR